MHPTGGGGGDERDVIGDGASAAFMGGFGADEKRVVYLIFYFLAFDIRAG